MPPTPQPPPPDPPIRSGRPGDTTTELTVPVVAVPLKDLHLQTVEILKVQRALGYGPKKADDNALIVRHRRLA